MLVSFILFLQIICLFNTILCIILLPNDRAQATPVDAVTTIKPTRVADKAIEVSDHFFNVIIRIIETVYIV